jgi:hypothetical protein
MRRTIVIRHSSSMLAQHSTPFPGFLTFAQCIHHASHNNVTANPSLLDDMQANAALSSKSTDYSDRAPVSVIAHRSCLHSTPARMSTRQLVPALTQAPKLLGLPGSHSPSLRTASPPRLASQSTYMTALLRCRLSVGPGQQSTSPRPGILKQGHLAFLARQSGVQITPTSPSNRLLTSTRLRPLRAVRDRTPALGLL